jgi:hypothetical protein
MGFPWFKVYTGHRGTYVTCHRNGQNIYNMSVFPHPVATKTHFCLSNAAFLADTAFDPNEAVHSWASNAAAWKSRYRPKTKTPLQTNEPKLSAKIAAGKLTTVPELPRPLEVSRRILKSTTPNLPHVTKRWKVGMRILTMKNVWTKTSRQLHWQRGR